MIIIQLGEWAIDPQARSIGHGATTRRVTPKAMRVLEELIQASGSVVSRGRLLDAAWPGVTVGEEVLTHAIAELRRAFEETSGRSAPLGTIYKSGYRLTVPADEAARDPHDGEGLASFAPFLAARCLSELDGIDNVNEALRLYRAAISNDPGFAGAHSGLSMKMVCCRFCHGGPPSTLEHALDHARRAVELDRNSAEPWLAYGNALAAVGDWAGAVASFKSAMRLAPNLGETWRLLGVVLFRTGAFEAASAACDRAAALLPDEAGILVRSARARRAMNDEAGSAARLSKARVRVDRRLREDPGDLRANCQLFSCLIEAEEREQAMAHVEPVLGVADPVTNILIGGLARSGEVDLALDQLEAAMEGGWSDPETLARDPDIVPLKSEPRFARITAHLR